MEATPESQISPPPPKQRRTKPEWKAYAVVKCSDGEREAVELVLQGKQVKEINKLAKGAKEVAEDEFRRAAGDMFFDADFDRQKIDL